MSRTLSSDRRSAAVRATVTFDTAPTATYRPDAERIVISLGTVSVLLSPGAARELAHSLAAAVDAYEGHWQPDPPAAGADSAGSGDE